MSFVVRPFDPKDREGVIALWNAVFPDDPPWNDPGSMIERKLSVQPHLFLVCELDGSVVGTVMAGFDGVRGWGHKVATHPDFRRRGIAQELMRAAEEGLAALGCTKLNLQVRDGNDPAAAFYRELGYSEEQRLSMSKHIGDGAREFG